MDAFGNQVVVEGEDQLVVDQHVLPALLVLDLLDVADLLLVVLEEGPAPGEALLDLLADQSLADEDLARLGRRQRAVVDAPLGVDHDAVERRPLPGGNLHRALFPVRVEELALDQVSAHFLDPVGLDAGDAAPEQARRLGDLGGHDPLAGLLLQRRRRVDQVADAARAEVVAGFVRLAADVAEQPGEQRHVDGVVGAGNVVFLPAQLGDHRVQLAVHLAPFAQAQIRQEIRVDRIDQLPVGFLVLDGIPEPGPQLHPGQELGFLVGELPVLFVGRLLALLRTFARVLHRQRGGDDQHFLEAAEVARGDQHAADARVERQLAQRIADLGQAVVVVERAEFLQQRVAVADRLGRRRLDEREALDVGQLQRLHAQDDAGQRRTQDFRVGERRPGVEIRLVVQAHADAGRHPAATPGPLPRRRLRNALDLQLLDLVAVRIALDPRQPGVDDVADARHGQRGFGDVGRQHDAPLAAGRLEDAVLLGSRQAREQRQDFRRVRRRQPRPRQRVLAQGFRRLADFPFAGQEDEDVAAAQPRQFVGGIDDRVVEIALVVLLFQIGDRPVAHLDRVQPAGHLDHRRAVEMLRKALGVDGRRGDDQLQVRAPGQQLLQVAEQEVDVQAALVRLVDDDRLVGVQPGVGLRLGEQDAVGHQLDPTVRGRTCRGSGFCTPTPAPTCVFNSCASRVATERAASRRGCVWPIRPRAPRPRSRQIFGNCVVLPEPVSPQTITTWFFAISSAMSARRSLTGRSGWNSGRGSLLRRSATAVRDAASRAARSACAFSRFGPTACCSSRDNARSRRASAVRVSERESAGREKCLSRAC